MNQTDFGNRGVFLNLAALFEGGLVVVAMFLGWLVGINPFESLNWEWPALGWGIVAAVPLFLLFLVFHFFPIGPLRTIKRLLAEVLGPSLAACRWYDMLLLALLAGFAEEVLFRGVLQPWFEGPHRNVLFGWICSNILFGLAHLVTPTYAVIAAAIGMYLSWLLDATGHRNLVVPVAAHFAYDFLAFLVVAWAIRHSQIDNQGSEGCP